MLSSGLHSGDYLQCALYLAEPRRAARAGGLLADALRRAVPEIDLVVSPAMGGLIISEEYASRIDYCSPYLIVGQLAITSIEKSREYRVRETLTFTRDNIGVKQLSRADLFVQKRCIQATRVFVSSKKDAEAKLLSGEIDVYIDDAPVIWDLVKRNRKHGFVTLQWKLTNDAMAWAVKRGNDELCSSVNEVLAKWRADGTINTVIRNWIPGAAKSRNNPRQP